jgi:hypothetical protein
MSAWDACPVPFVEQPANCVVVISHDRWFLDRIATHILAFEGDSKVTLFDGTVRGRGLAARHGLHGRWPAAPLSDVRRDHHLSRASISSGWLLGPSA